VSLLERTRDRAGEMGVSPKRSLGQNFLIAESVVDRIVEATKALAPAEIIEVGPGMGALTDKLFELSCPLRLIELDREMARYWRERNFNVVEDDALKVNWEKISTQSPTVLVSNLPYQISTHLVVDRCLGPMNLTGMVLMFQREVADRLVAKPKSKAYGILSVIVQSHWEIRKVVNVGPRAFWPMPNVASQVVQFTRKVSPLPGRTKEFLSFVKAAFAQRRKFLRKNLLAVRQLLKVGEDDLPAALESLGIGAKARPEELSVQDFIKLFTLVGK
jgi:16S rRNA (adenine1518-N6/adenine1519-N6)-dimethyltransferase